MHIIGHEKKMLASSEIGHEGSDDRPFGKVRSLTLFEPERDSSWTILQWTRMIAFELLLVSFSNHLLGRSMMC